MVHQLIFGTPEAENGKIKRLRESTNLIELGRWVFANGLADYKVSEDCNAH